MRLVPSFLVGLLVAAFAPAAEPEVVPILAQGPWPLPTHAPTAGTRERQTLVLRSEQELANAAGPNALAAVKRSLKVEAIDFDKQMLLVVADGTLPMVGTSGGAPPSVPVRIEIASVAVDGDTLRVAWRHSPRVKDELITHPLEVVLVPHSAGEVKFERLPARVGGPGPEEKPAAGQAVAVVARAFWADGWKPELPARHWTVRSADDLIDPRLRAPEPVLERLRQEALARYARALKVESIDFGKQMIVGVSAGVQPGDGYRVEVVRVEKDAEKNQTTVRWRLHAPKEAAGNPTHPAAVALIAKVAGEPAFVEEGRER